MRRPVDIEQRDGHRGHGFWAMVACCAPMLVIVGLIVLKAM